MFKKILNWFHPDEKVIFGRQVLFALSGLLIVNLFLVNFFSWQMMAISSVVVIAFLLTLKFTRPAFYLMLLLYPFIGWQITVGSINAPVVDFLGMAVLGAWILRLIFSSAKEKITWRDWPGIIFYGLFIVSAILSMFNAEFLFSGLKYILRPLIFLYLIFVILPFNLIKTKKQLQIALWLLIIAGIAVGLLGFVNVIIGGDTLFTSRALPYSFGDFNPVGGNQNAVAEIMIITLPLILYMLVEHRKHQQQSWLIVLIGWFLLVLFLTLSRSGLLALILQVFILLMVFLAPRVKKTRLFPLLVGIIIIPLVFYFGYWQNIDWVQSSNLNRLVLSELSFSAFLEHPIIGNGAGGFMNIVAQTFVFVVDFGDPLDSHGFIQKVMVEQGLFGLIGFMSFLIYIFTMLVRAYWCEDNKHQKFQLLCFIMLFAGIMLFQLFSTSYYLSRVWIPIAVILAGARLYQPKVFEKII